MSIELYTLPDGWLECDACGRPMHHSHMDRHVGSVACQLEQRPNSAPEGWIPIGNAAAATSGFDRKYAGVHALVDQCRLPAYRPRAPGGSTEWWVPKWVVVLGTANATDSAKRYACERARDDMEYRAALLAALRLIGGKDDLDAVTELFLETALFED